MTYPKGGAAVTTASPAYTAIPFVDTDPGTYDRDAKYLTTTAHDTINGKGDICKYLTQMGWAPQGKRWRMPTSLEFDAEGDYTKVGTFNGITGNANGTFTISSGYQRKDLNTPYFPVSGGRDTSGGLYGPGTGGAYWSSSPSTDTNNYRLFLSNTTIDTKQSNDRRYGASVRCVVE